ncbi:nitrogen permease regulator 2 [Pleomassaria siparia CBS 279.74]|uniref:Nitrogen permease regulator 2 n=1 Tax=Pleomassaria siparia CBS 279.74 TaxID=1314801 RepID=A0A6G1KLQ7_9PLEO|nr:nitrogen permease regulator 2 [Pleomassaria siparia CBS 279.74]
MPTRSIKSIFFTRFHHRQGSRVLHQVPEGSITNSTAPAALDTPLFDFESVTQYLIPKQDFCDRLLTFCTNHHRVIGYPVCVREGKYYRNEFIFNFAVVVGEDMGDWVSYAEVVRKLGRLLRGLEEQGGFLSREEGGSLEDDGGGQGGGGLGLGMLNGNKAGSKVYALCEMVLEDLNNYAECMIPIDDSNTINLKLFPTHPPPPPIHPHHVPLLTISLSSLTSPISSDLTLTRILPFINGIHSVSHIAQLADTDVSLTRKAIQHLVYYGCLVLLDIFTFGAVYAPTAEMGWFVTDSSVQEECARYVAVPQLRFGREGGGSASTNMVGGGGGGESSEKKSRDERSSVSSEASQRSDISSTTNATLNLTTPTSSGLNDPTDSFSASSSSSARPKVDPETLITLYVSLRQGLTLKNWVLENLSLLHGIDIRRFITFGIIKGILYRVHKYAIATSTFTSPATRSPATNAASTIPPSIHRDSDQSTIRGHANARHLSHKASLASTVNIFATHESTSEVPFHGENDKPSGGLPLVKFLDGMHCFDEICTELGMGEQVVEKKVKGAGEVQIVHR